MPESEWTADQLSKSRQRCLQHNPNLVAEMINAILSTVRQDLSCSKPELLVQIGELADAVSTARAEIVALGADDITASHIPSATDELDAIVVHTAAATDSILGCCEQLDAMSSRLDKEDAQVIQTVVTRIYEACSFQDITGQRITKVVSALKAIEAKVAHMMGVFPSDVSRACRSARKTTVPDERSLLNGPQFLTSAMHQSDVDALLASFD